MWHWQSFGHFVWQSDIYSDTLPDILSIWHARAGILSDIQIMIKLSAYHSGILSHIQSYFWTHVLTCYLPFTLTLFHFWHVAGNSWGIPADIFFFLAFYLAVRLSLIYRTVKKYFGTLSDHSSGRFYLDGFCYSVWHWHWFCLSFRHSGKAFSSDPDSVTRPESLRTWQPIGHFIWHMFNGSLFHIPSGTSHLAKTFSHSNLYLAQPIG